jgi:hypothetical protein
VTGIGLARSLHGVLRTSVMESSCLNFLFSLFVASPSEDAVFEAARMHQIRGEYDRAVDLYMVRKQSLFSSVVILTLP